MSDENWTEEAPHERELYVVEALSIGDHWHTIGYGDLEDLRRVCDDYPGGGPYRIVKITQVIMLREKREIIE